MDGFRRTRARQVRTVGSPRGAWFVAATIMLAAGFVTAGCGATSSRTGAGTSKLNAVAVSDGSSESLYGGVRGGALTVYQPPDFGPLDPGESYGSDDFQVIYATQRPLFSNLPNQQTPVP